MRIIGIFRRPVEHCCPCTLRHVVLPLPSDFLLAQHCHLRVYSGCSGRILLVRNHLTDICPLAVVRVCCLPRRRNATGAQVGLGADSSVDVHQRVNPLIFFFHKTALFSGGGFILENAIRNFSQMALFQPVINGMFSRTSEQALTT